MTLCPQFQGCGQSSAYALYLPTADIDAWRERKEYEAKRARHNSVTKQSSVVTLCSQAPEEQRIVRRCALVLSNERIRKGEGGAGQGAVRTKTASARTLTGDQ